MLLAFDCNSTRIRALQASQGQYPRSVCLDGAELDLPLLVQEAGSAPVFGHHLLATSRHNPQALVQNYLPRLGDKHTWTPGRRPVSALQIIEGLFKKLSPLAHSAEDILWSLPSYLSRGQVEIFHKLAEKQRWPSRGAVSNLLAWAIAGYEDQHWYSSAMVLDIDDNALSIGLVRAIDDQAHVVEVRHVQHLGWIAWRERLLNALADSCVLQSRRDPRAYPWAEQALFDQLPNLLEACQKNRVFQINLQGQGWFQNLFVQPEQIVGWSAVLLRHIVREVSAVWHQVGLEAPNALLLSPAVARLPGLVNLLRQCAEDWATRTRDKAAEEDFGDRLFPEAGPASSQPVVLGPDAGLKALHSLADALLAEADFEWFDSSVPLPAPMQVESGPPRLQYQGRDYFLEAPTFFLGRQVGCDLTFDDEFERVAGRHCEIVHERRGYLIKNRSREVTLVNDTPISDAVVLQPGDWIRLGHEGPRLRFLGRSHPAPLIA